MPEQAGEPKIFSGETEAGAALAQKTPRERVCRHETCTASTASGFQGFLFLPQKPRKMRAAVIALGLGLCVPGIAGAGANPDPMGPRAFVAENERNEPMARWAQGCPRHHL